MHNSQPWRFRLDEDTVEVWGDRDRTPPLADSSGWAMRVAGGAVTFNLWLALTVRTRLYQVRWLPSNSEPDLLALVSPAGDEPSPPESTEEHERLYRAIALRHSTRTGLRPYPVPAAARAQILQAARRDGAWGELVIGVPAVTAVAEITRAAQRVLDSTPGYPAEQRSWSDHSGHLAATGGDAGPAPSRARWEPSIPQAPGADGSDPLVLVLGTSGDLPIDHLRAGSALQRVLLTVTDLGLGYQLYSQPIEVVAAREQLRLALGRHGTPQMVLRIGYADTASASPRRAAGELIDD
jgi:hypothetical protein